ncbi:putative anthranilate synthase component II [Mycobacterium xenopi 4042]|uniref:Putative anthranilate synthase component II n=1 Tax=Mycobacterium xenopi 4042 TaxID=1299334 RepID=X8CKN1_MYCXE|nr:putative anthranilate synthase component II [Mycobacterium xenopi 4042]
MAFGPPSTAHPNSCTAKPAVYFTRMLVCCKDFRILSPRPGITR